MCESSLEIRWDYILAIVVIVSVTATVISGKATAANLIEAISLMIAFLTGSLAVRTLRMNYERLFDERLGKKKT